MTDVFSGLTGTDDLLLPSPRFVPLIGVSVTTFPPGAAVMDLTSPRRVMKVGWVSPGRLGSDPSWPADLFFEDAKWIDFERELITYPTPGIYCDRIRYHLEPGAVATLYVNDTGVPAVPKSALNPWDRAATFVTLGTTGQTTPGGSVVTSWTYTVPTGKILMLSRAAAVVRRWTAASAVNYVIATLGTSYGHFLYVFHLDNVVGGESRDDLDGGPLYVPAGVVLSGTINDNSTGGSCHFVLLAQGLLFDA